MTRLGLGLGLGGSKQRWLIRHIWRLIFGFLSNLLIVEAGSWINGGTSTMNGLADTAAAAAAVYFQRF